MNVNPRTAFFDGIAGLWDGWDNLEVLAQRMDAGLTELGVLPGETVLDVGCGTGNLTLALLKKLGPEGRVVAVDISARMLEVARGKVSDPRVSWHLEDARRLPLGDGTCHRVVCYSVWPHFTDRPQVAAELVRVLRPGGALHIWHLSSREKVNAIHAGAGEAVRSDILPPKEDTAAVLAGAGLTVTFAEETDARYLVTGVKA